MTGDPGRPGNPPDPGSERPHPPGYSEIGVGDARALVRDGMADFVERAIRSAGSLYDHAAAHPDAEAIQGRGTLYFIPGPGPERWVVRHLGHGGLLAPLTGDRFLRLGVPRPYNEVYISCLLRRRGIPTPEVFAAVVYPAGPLFYRGDVGRDEVPDARDLADSLFTDDLDEPDRVAALTAAARLLRWLHHEGVVHPDLNLRNVLLCWRGRPPRAYILDLEKCAVYDRVSEHQRLVMLRRFMRSARKFERRTGRRITEREWECFHTAYAEFPGPDA